MRSYKQTLRRLAVGDDRTALADPAGLDCRTRAFAQLGAMFALGAGAASYRAVCEPSPPGISSVSILSRPAGNGAVTICNPLSVVIGVPCSETMDRS